MTRDATDPHSLLGPYVLDALGAEERASFESHLEGCDTCRRELMELRSVPIGLSEATEEAPPEGLRARILLAAAQTDQLAPEPSRDQHDRNGDREAARWPFRVVAAAAAVLVVAVAGLSYLVADLAERVDDREVATQQAHETIARITAVLAADDASLSTATSEDGVNGRVVASTSQGEAVIVTDGLDPAPSARVYQLWIIDASGATPAGLFDTDANGRAVEIVTGDLHDDVVIGVTLEPEGGSPQPTSDPVFAIELAAAAGS